MHVASFGQGGMNAALSVDGFAVVERVFDGAALGSLGEALAPLARSRAGARHAMQSPAVAEFAREPRLLSIVHEVLGPGSVPYRATLFDKSRVANWLVVWHQDTALPLAERRDVPGWGPWSVKAGVHYAHAPTAALDNVLALRIHLDDCTVDSGPLRVIPGTHRLGVLTDDAVQAVVRDAEPVDCLVGRGGVLAMRPLIIHASSKCRADTHRRVLHIEYASSMEIGGGLRLAIG
jgi:ectoine hydroxylase-related dioxygenase (phytanoyl-CoA dioxygenase family)